MIIPLRSCCFVFNLRQGTLLIAVVELILSAICLFLLLLGSTHAQDMEAKLGADIAESQQEEEFRLVEDEENGIQYNNNEISLLTAQHLALVMIIFLYTGIAIVTIHLVSCVLLVYGAIMEVRQFVLPWIFIVLMVVIVAFCGILVYKVLGYGSELFIIIVLLIIHIRLGLWLVVASFYHQLASMQMSSCAAMIAQEEATNIKAAYMNFPYSNKPSEV